jgi:biotin carboxyl carrier protein
MEHLRITVEGKVYDVIVEKIDSGDVAIPAAPASVVRTAAPVAITYAATPAPASQIPAGEGDATSPLAGIVNAINVVIGANVNAGDLIMTLEAMKMYTAINATVGGTIKAIHVKVNDAVEEGQILYTIG